MRRISIVLSFGLIVALVVLSNKSGKAADQTILAPQTEVAIVEHSSNPSSVHNYQAAAGHEIDPALEIMKRCEDRYRNVYDYTAKFVKQEADRSTGELSEVQYHDLKLRGAPFSVYMHWLEPNSGQEVIFIEGLNNNKILTHTTGIAKALTGTLKLDPDSSTAMKGQRHSIREIGIGSLIRQLIHHWEFDRRFRDCKVEVGHVKINGRPCWRIVVSHPVPDQGKYMFHTAKVYVDKELELPIRFEGYAWPTGNLEELGPLQESYTYVDLRVNVGLSDMDFSTSNPRYQYSRF